MCWIRKIYAYFVFCILIFCNSLYSQETLGPRSLDTINSLFINSIDEIPIYTTPVPNVDSLINYEIELNKDGEVRPEFYGYAYNVNLELNSTGLWNTLENGDRIWRIRIRCPGAFSINLVFENFELVENSDLYFYNKEQDFFTGPFSASYNKQHKKFATHLIKGEETIVELYEPKSELGLSNFRITRVVYGYKNAFIDFESYKKSIFENELQSGSCNIDANCPEGNDWCKEKSSVALILVNAFGDPKYGWCSGSLINNTRNDYTPYFLTAFHCLDFDKNGRIDLDEKQWLETWSFRFRYMRELCNWGNMITYDFSSADFISAYGISDFALLKLQDQPISGQKEGAQDVYFNGWDRTGDTPDETTCLHHPSGDYMKISIDHDPPVSSSYLDKLPNNNTHWKVIWNNNINENNGVTEGGSSGSPLYSSTHKVIGQLHGGYSSCNNATAPDWYGKFSVSWLGGGTNETSLHHWLDPDNTGAETLDGIKMPNLQYGWNILDGQNFLWAAYSVLKIGSSQIAPFSVYAGANLTLKVGKEIVIRPCTKILEGSTFRAYIDEISCTDLVYLSDKESDYNPNICGTYPPKIAANDIETLPYEHSRSLSIHPNPFNSDATISIDVQEEGNLSLKVMDMLGNSILTFADNQFFTNGIYNFTINSSNITSGLYFVLLQTQNDVITQKIMVIK